MLAALERREALEQLSSLRRRRPAEIDRFVEPRRQSVEAVRDELPVEQPGPVLVQHGDVHGEIGLRREGLGNDAPLDGRRADWRSGLADRQRTSRRTAEARAEVELRLDDDRRSRGDAVRDAAGDGRGHGLGVAPNGHRSPSTVLEDDVAARERDGEIERRPVCSEAAWGYRTTLRSLVRLEAQIHHDGNRRAGCEYTVRLDRWKTDGRRAFVL